VDRAAPDCVTTTAAAPSNTRIANCVNEIHLEFSVDSPERRENSLHKIETLIAALERFRGGLAAEAELRARRDRGA
jgi:hypothetical protein